MATADVEIVVDPPPPVTEEDAGGAEAEAEVASAPTCAWPGPDPDNEYPLEVVYCGVCSLPSEYCEFNAHLYPKCIEWLEENQPEMMTDSCRLAKEKHKEGGKKGKKRGGKGTGGSTKKEVVPQLVTVFRAARGKKKSVTVIKGLLSHGIAPKDASKALSSKFSCGASVTGEDEIVIQGDIKENLIDFISEKWSEVTYDMIKDLGDQKRT